MRPRVVAAGHRHVFIHKSGRTFPAFLVRLPIIQRGHPSVDGDVSEEVAYRWRSKLDFLLLSRALSAGCGSKETRGVRPLGKLPIFPKGVYAKLAEAAVASEWWLRPVDDDDTTDLLRAALWIDGVGGNGGKGLADVGGYHPRMKKSLIQLDSFLSAALDMYNESCSWLDGLGRETISVKDEAIILAWELFCRNKDVEDLVVPPGKGSSLVGEITEVAMCSLDVSNIRNDSHLPRQRIWLPNKTNQTDQWTAAGLGQYFANDANAKKVVGTAIQAVTNLHREKGRSDIASVNWRNYVFIEPSCGDGRILHQLLEALKISGISPLGVIGYDIDPTIIGKCRERCQGCGSPYQTDANTFLVMVHCRDFLSVTREDILSDLANSVQEADYVGQTFPSENSSLRFVFVGGPPYSTRPVEGNAIKHDLPVQFTNHCLFDLGAEVVSFLLPSRCGRDGDMACEVMKKENSILQGFNEGPNYDNKAWQRLTKELDDSSFDFLGQVVTQPSILCCWFRKIET